MAWLSPAVVKRNNCAATPGLEPTTPSVRRRAAKRGRFRRASVLRMSASSSVGHRGFSVLNAAENSSALTRNCGATRRNQKHNMENSNISWTNNTFNPWIGCTKVSPGCLHCYAESLMDTRRKRVKWGRGNPRSRTSAEYWKQPMRWNKQAAAEGKRIKVFCASLADVFDGEVADAWRDDLFTLIRNTPNLDWQLLTKRPENAVRYAAGIQWPQNAWLGVSVEDQERAGRAEIIAQVPAPVRFLSCEPLLGPVKLNLNGIGWVIVGGESGPGCRPMQKEWVIDIHDQCRAANVPFFFKQWGGNKADAGGHLLDGVTYHEFPTLVLRQPVVPAAMELKEAA